MKPPGLARGPVFTLSLMIACMAFPAASGAQQPGDTETVIEPEGLFTPIALVLKPSNRPVISYRSGQWDSSGVRIHDLETGQTFTLGLGSNGGVSPHVAPHLDVSPTGSAGLAYSDSDPIDWTVLGYDGQLDPGSGTMVRGIDKYIPETMTFAFGKDGRPRIAYMAFLSRFEIGRAEVRFARWTGTEWDRSVLDPTLIVTHQTNMSMAVNRASGETYLSYTAWVYESSMDLKLLRLSPSGHVLGSRTIQSGDARGDEGMVGVISNTVVDRAGQPHVLFKNEHYNRFYTSELRYFSGGILETIAENVDIGNDISIGVSTDLRPIVAYRVYNPSSGLMELRILERKGANRWEPLPDVTSSPDVWSADLAIGTDDVLQVAYVDGRDGKIKLVQRPLEQPCRLSVQAYSQKDPAWIDKPYDHQGTIGKYGCALSSLAMGLNFAGARNNPLELNTIMTEEGTFTGASVNWASTVNVLAQRDELRSLNLQWVGRSSRRDDLVAGERELEELVCKGRRPVIVGVKFRLNSKGLLRPNHFVLVVGKEGDRFVIIDPLQADRTYLDHYYADFNTGRYPYQGGFELRGYVAGQPGINGLEPATDVNTLALEAGGQPGGLDLSATDVHLLLSDASGRRTGLDLASGESREEIPQSVHFLDSLEDGETEEPLSETGHFLYVTEPAEGTYHLTATPLQDGPFQITIRAASRDGSLQPPVVLEGQGGAGKTVAYEIELSSSPGSQIVTVRDLEPPVITGVEAQPALLWPPNHRMTAVTVSYTATDNSRAAPACTLEVASNQPVNGTGDGDTSPDWSVIDPHHVRLRAERDGKSKAGRVYTLTIACVDAAGNMIRRTATVTVPKSRG